MVCAVDYIAAAPQPNELPEPKLRSRFLVEVLGRPRWTSPDHLHWCIRRRSVTDGGLGDLRDVGWRIAELRSWLDIHVYISMPPCRRRLSQCERRAALAHGL